MYESDAEKLDVIKGPLPSSETVRLHSAYIQVCIFSFLLLQDRFADARSLPPVDKQQDYELTGFQESGGKTVLKFKRKFDTCDSRDRKLEVSIYTLASYYRYHKTVTSLDGGQALCTRNK